MRVEIFQTSGVQSFNGMLWFDEAEKEGGAGIQQVIIYVERTNYDPPPVQSTQLVGWRCSPAGAEPVSHAALDR